MVPSRSYSRVTRLGQNVFGNRPLRITTLIVSYLLLMVLGGEGVESEGGRSLRNLTLIMSDPYCCCWGTSPSVSPTLIVSNNYCWGGVGVGVGVGRPPRSSP